MEQALKSIDESFDQMKRNVKHAVLDVDPKHRAEYCNKLIKQLESVKNSFSDFIKSYYDLMDRAISASETIRIQNELIEKLRKR